MDNITMTKTTPTTGVWIASPTAANRGLTVGIRPSYDAPMYQAFAVKDVAQFRSGRPPA